MPVDTTDSSASSSARSGTGIGVLSWIVKLVAEEGVEMGEGE